MFAAVVNTSLSWRLGVVPRVGVLVNLLGVLEVSIVSENLTRNLT